MDTVECLDCEADVDRVNARRGADGTWMCVRCARWYTDATDHYSR